MLTNFVGNPSQKSLSNAMANPIHPSKTLGLETGKQRARVEVGGRRGEEESGVFLTWRDLWVKVSDRRGGTKSILEGVSGYAMPGKLLAVMGPSSSGKSTLLDAIAGRLHPNTRQAGEILIDGHKQALTYGTSAYVTDFDALTISLTVREAVSYSAELQLPEGMKRAEKKERAENTIREMGLQDVMDTRIGGWGVKGISSGQKRRVSICIELLTHPKLLFLDEPTSGLDSAASYYVMRRIANLARDMDGVRRTIIASIHQPSSEVFQLFDSLCLLSAGRTVYFGLASAACRFFALSGFPCPTLQNPSDHFLKTINKDFEYDIEKGVSGATPTEKAIEILVNSFKSSQSYKQVQTQISKVLEEHDPNSKEFQGFEALKKKNNGGFITQCVVLTRRSFVNMYRDVGYYWLRLVMYVALAVGLATVFYDIGTTGSIQARGSLLMFVSSFLTFMTMGGFPSLIEDMKVFLRERVNGHYGVAAFTTANTVSVIPYLVLISIIPGAITYYFPGLHRGSENFIYFVGVLFICMMMVESLMMTVSSMVPSFVLGLITGAGIQGLMILGIGFFRRPNDLPKPFWKYPLYYIAFHKYAYQGMFKNEFEGLVLFPSDQGRCAQQMTGDEILRDVWQVEMSYSKWVDLAILLGMVLFYRLAFIVVIKMVEKIKPLVASYNHSKLEPKSAERCLFTKLTSYSLFSLFVRFRFV